MNLFAFFYFTTLNFFYDDERCKINFPVRDNKVLLYCIVYTGSTECFVQVAICCSLKENNLFFHCVNQVPTLDGVGQMRPLEDDDDYDETAANHCEVSVASR